MSKANYKKYLAEIIKELKGYRAGLLEARSYNESSNTDTLNKFILNLEGKDPKLQYNLVKNYLESIDMLTTYINVKEEELSPGHPLIENLYKNINNILYKITDPETKIILPKKFVDFDEKLHISNVNDNNNNNNNNNTERVLNMFNLKYYPKERSNLRTYSSKSNFADPKPFSFRKFTKEARKSYRQKHPRNNNNTNDDLSGGKRKTRSKRNPRRKTRK
uniref:Uncharacterized protein n=1 Tax=viral metagenome TaxID=1070528 RepID=A0A6C0DK10_9ZZZZ